MEKKEPIDIILVTFERLHLLKKTVEKINKRTLYPFNLIVVDNGSKDNNETHDYLNRIEKLGYVHKRLSLDKNLGLPMALNEGLKYVKSEYFITTQDDLIPPDLRPCWLERLLHIYKKYEDDYAGLCMRIQRNARLVIDEDEELIQSPKSLPAVFRIQKRDDFRKGVDFGTRKHWESQSFVDTARNVLKKKTAMVTKLYADHTGYMVDNKGFAKGKVDFFTYSGEVKMKQNIDKPYADIDRRSNYPIKINHPYDRHELNRMKEWLVGKGRDENESTLEQQDVLGKYCKGFGLDIGCGPNRKCHPTALGVDIYPYGEHVDIVHDGSDLWMFDDNQLDYIVSCHSLEHFPDAPATVDEWARVIKIGGHIAIIVPDGESRPHNIRIKMVINQHLQEIHYFIYLNHILKQ